MRKVKVRTLYLIAIIVGGLVGLATKSTYAMFTASAEIDNPICMSTNLTSEEETIETMEVVVTAGEKKTVPVTINNTSTNTVGYSVWYTSPSDKVKIGIKLSNSDSSNSTDNTFYGDGSAYFVSSVYGVTPVLFLNSEQTFLKGTGASSDPYQLSV